MESEYNPDPTSPTNFSNPVYETLGASRGMQPLGPAPPVSMEAMATSHQPSSQLEDPAKAEELKSTDKNQNGATITNGKKVGFAPSLVDSGRDTDALVEVDDD